MMTNKLDEYLKGENFIGLDKLLIWQRLVDGSIALRLGVTSLAPIGFIVGFVAGLLVCSML